MFTTSAEVVLGTLKVRGEEGDEEAAVAHVAGFGETTLRDEVAELLTPLA